MTDVQPVTTDARPLRVTERDSCIVLVVPRGEAVRNFLYSDTLSTLASKARVVVLSVVDDEALLSGVRNAIIELVPLHHNPPAPWAFRLRVLTENAHDRWLWSEVAKNNWELRDRRAAEQGKRLQRTLIKASSRALAWGPALRTLTRIERWATLRTSDTGEFEALFDRLQPDLVFNCSHIHGIAGELPLKIAHSKGIPTAGFIFSWDNLTSRSRIFVPYDHWLVWSDVMRRKLLQIYPQILGDHVHVTGTPQFDYHFRPEFDLGREELCRRIGIDPSRPFVLYTAGIAHHFFDEHLHVESVIDILSELEMPERPQLVVRTNIKDTSPEMDSLAARDLADVVFPRASWDVTSLTPREDDLGLYSSLLRHCALGINAASTVSLELLMLGKPVINLDFDPAGSNLPWCLGYQRHIRFDHYQPVVESGAVMVAKSEFDLGDMLLKGLSGAGPEPSHGESLVKDLVGDAGTALGGKRVAKCLLDIAGRTT